MKMLVMADELAGASASNKPASYYTHPAKYAKTGIAPGDEHGEPCFSEGEQGMV